MRQKLSVIIPTKNEELRIARVIRSVRWADDIVVVDSESSDGTVDIARALGARVFVQPWLGWIGQKAFAVENALYDWILWVDADEIVTNELAQSIQTALAGTPSPSDGYVIERQEEFLGVLMPNMRRRSKRKSFVRIFNKTRSGWDPKQLIHEQIQCPGSLLPLAGKLLHWRNYTIAEQIATFLRNSETEATLIPIDKGFVFRFFLKPPARFIWLYFICGNWQFGIRGYVWSIIHSFAEFLSYAEAWESAYTIRLPHPPELSSSNNDFASEAQ